MFDRFGDLEKEAFFTGFVFAFGFINAFRIISQTTPPSLTDFSSNITFSFVRHSLCRITHNVCLFVFPYFYVSSVSLFNIAFMRAFIRQLNFSRLSKSSIAREKSQS
jgi:hypothetical protein